ncbi:MAG: hypothetical protein GXO07_06115 [Crenarchaeota archaeon]|nr:hypothetical protein [Thermoproteota archaeon]
MACLKLVFEALQAMAVKSEEPGKGFFADSYVARKKVVSNNKTDRVVYIPASSLKGSLRKVLQYASEELQLAEGWEELFGDEKNEGRLFFEDCECKRPCLTEVRPGVALNKALGTVMEKRLFFRERVALGTKFECRVCGGERDLELLEELLNRDLVRKYFYYVGLGDGMVKLVEVKRE